MATVGDYSLPVSLPEGQAHQMKAPSLESYIPQEYALEVVPDLPQLETSPTPEQAGEMGEFTKGVNRGIDQMQALGAGGVALVADLLGMDTLREWGYDEYVAQMEEAAQYNPEVAQFTDIDSPGAFVAWMAGTAGELAPQVIASIISGGVGAAATKQALKLALKQGIKKGMAQGLSKQAATKAALGEVGAKMVQRGAAGAVFGQTALQEGGGMYASAAEHYGLENVPLESQLGALGLGAAAGGLEMLGIESAILKSGALRKLTGAKPISNLAEKRLAKRLAKHMSTQGLAEGATEGLQETLNIIHASGYRDVTMDDLYGVLNSVAAGAAGGVMFGVTGVGMPKNPATEQLNAMENADATGDPNKTVDDAIAEQETLRDEAVKQIRTNSNPEIQEIDQQISDINNAVARGEIDPIAGAAQVTQIQDQKKTAQANLKRDAQRTLGEADKKLVKLQESKMALNKDPHRMAWERDLAKRLDDFAWQTALPLRENLEMRDRMPAADFMRTSQALTELTKRTSELATQIKKTIPGEQWRTEAAVTEFINTFVPKLQHERVQDAYNRERLARQESARSVVATREGKERVRQEQEERATREARRDGRLAESRLARRRAEMSIAFQEAADQMGRAEEQRFREATQITPADILAPQMGPGGYTTDKGTPGVYPTQISAEMTQPFEPGIIPSAEAPSTLMTTQGPGAVAAQTPTTYPRAVTVEKVPSAKQIQERRRVKKAPVTTVEKTYRYIENALKKLPQLRDKVTVVTDVTDGRFPSEYQKDAKNAKAVFIEKTGQIYLFANNIKNKQDAVKAVLHEGIAHFGLRTIFNNVELQRFLTAVYETKSSSAQFKKLILEDARYKNLNAIDQAEEYVAILAERARIGYRLGQSEKKVWNRVKNLLKLVLKKIGLVKITDKDISDVITASIFNLAKQNSPNLYKKEYTLPSDIDKVRASSMGKNFLGEVAAGSKHLVARIKDEVDMTFKEYTEDVYGKKVIRRETTLDRLAQQLQNKMRRLEVVQRGIQETGGKITEQTNVYKIEEVSHNKTNHEIDNFYNKFIQGKGGLIDLVAKSATVGQLAKDAFAAVSRLAYALHALERNAVIEKRTNGKEKAGSGLTNEEAKQLINNLSTPARMAAVEKLNEINDYRLKLLEENHLLPQDVIDSWRQTYNNYVPLKGWEELTEQLLPTYMRSTTGIDAGKKPFSDFARGRTSVAADPMVSSIKQVEDVIKIKNRNEVARSLDKLVEDNKQYTDLWVTEKDAPNAFHKTLDRKTGKINLTKSRSKFTGRQREQVVTVIDENGLRKEILIKDPSLARAFKGGANQQVGKLTKVLGDIMRGVSKLFTTYNPEFWLTNVTRDLASAVINLGEIKTSNGTFSIPKGARTKMFTDFYKSFKAARAVITGDKKADADWVEAFKRFQEYGGYTEMFGLKSFEGLSNQLVRDVQKSLGQGFAGSMSAKTLEQAKDWMDATSSALENATRLNAFKQISEAYINQGMDPDSAYKRAASAALNLTVNFTRKGEASALMGSLFLFFNASMQSNARLMRTIFKNWDKGYGKKVLGGMILGSFMHGVLSRMFGGDDEDGVPYYDKIPQWERDSNLILMAPGGNYAKIPLPYGFNILHVIGQAFSDIAAGSWQGKDATNIVGDNIVRVFNSAFDNFVPMGSADEGLTMFVPSILRPAMQIQMNKNWMGKPIYPETREFHKGELPDSQKYWASVSDMSRIFAQFLNKATGGTTVTSGLIDVSPESIDHMISSYTGGLGKLSSSVFELFKKVATTGDLSLVERRDIPGIRKLIGDADQYYNNSAIYYNLRDRIGTAEMALEAAKMEGGKAIRNVRTEYKEELALASSLKLADNQLRRIGKRLKSLRDRYSISGTIGYGTFHNKKKLIDEQRKKIMQRFIKKAEAKGI